MKLSTRAKYGLKALIDLGLYSEKEAVSLQSIAGQYFRQTEYIGKLSGAADGTFEESGPCEECPRRSRRILPWKTGRRDFSGRYPSCPGGRPGGCNMSGNRR